MAVPDKPDYARGSSCRRTHVSPNRIPSAPLRAIRTTHRTVVGGGQMAIVWSTQEFAARFLVEEQLTHSCGTILFLRY